MGKKIEIERIENNTRRQVTFSKRRTSLIKKATELSIFCDIDIALVAFSPSGRVSKYCSRDRIGDVVERYMNLPHDVRYPHIRNIEGKLAKLNELDDIAGGENKVHILNSQIELVEMQIRRKTAELVALDDQIKKFVPDESENPSLSKVLLLEEHLKKSLQQVIDRKNTLPPDPPSTELELDGNVNDTADSGIQKLEEIKDPTSSKLLMRLDPWLNTPYRWSRLRDNFAKVSSTIPYDANPNYSAFNPQPSWFPQTHFTNQQPATWDQMSNPNVQMGFGASPSSFREMLSGHDISYGHHQPPSSSYDHLTPNTGIFSGHDVPYRPQPRSFSYHNYHLTPNMVNVSRQGGVTPPMSKFDAMGDNNDFNWLPSRNCEQFTNNDAAATKNMSRSNYHFDPYGKQPETFSHQAMDCVAESSSHAEARHMILPDHGTQTTVIDGGSDWDEYPIFPENVDFDGLDVLFD